MLIFSSWNFLQADFPSWNLLHPVFCFFVKHDACWFLLVKLVARGLSLQETQCITICVLRNLDVFSFLLHEIFSCWFVSLWNSNIDFSLMKPILLVELIACWYFFVKLYLSWCFSSWNLLYVDFFFRET